MSDIDTDKLYLFLDIAGRESTPDGEAVNAVRMIKRMLVNGGKSFNHLRLSGVAHKPADATYSRMSHQDIKTRLKAADSRVLVLEKENRHLSSQLATKDAELSRLRSKGVRDDGTMPWLEFEFKLRTVHNYSMKYLKPMVCEHFEITEREYDQWRENGKVPASAVEKLKTFKPLKPEARTSKNASENGQQRSRGENSEAAKLLKNIEAAGATGIGMNSMAAGLLRRVNEFRQQGRVYVSDKRVFFGRATDWIPQLTPPQRVLLEFVKQYQDGISTSAAEEIVERNKLDIKSPQERLRTLKNLLYIEDNGLKGYKISLLGEEALVNPNYVSVKRQA